MSDEKTFRDKALEIAHVLRMPMTQVGTSYRRSKKTDGNSDWWKEKLEALSQLDVDSYVKATHNKLTHKQAGIARAHRPRPAKYGKNGRPKKDAVPRQPARYLSSDSDVESDNESEVKEADKEEVKASGQDEQDNKSDNKSDTQDQDYESGDEEILKYMETAVPPTSPREDNVEDTPTQPQEDLPPPKSPEIKRKMTKRNTKQIPRVKGAGNPLLQKYEALKPKSASSKLLTMGKFL